MHHNYRDFGSDGHRAYVHHEGEYADRPMKDLIVEAVQQGQRIIREEVRLAKLEVRNEAEGVVAAGKSVAVGGTLLMASVYLFLFGVCFALATLIPMWLSAFIVGAVSAGAGYFLCKGGIARVKALTPARQQTIATIKESNPWKAVTEREPATISRTLGNA